MINLKVLSTAAAMTLALPLVATGFSAAQAQDKAGGGAAVGGGGGGGFRGGGGGAAMGGGGGFRGGGGGPIGGGGAIGGGGGFRGVAIAPAGGGSFRHGGVAVGPTTGSDKASLGYRPGPGVAVAGDGRPNWGGGGRPGWGGGGRPHWHGGGYGYRHRGGFWPGVAIGAGLGSAYGYYGSGYYGSGYYDNSYYDDGYYDEPVVAAGPAVGDDSVAYCKQRYKSYDVRSGTYLGYDGQRHPCPAQ